jgi:hypothetical protein
MISHTPDGENLLNYAHCRPENVRHARPDARQRLRALILAADTLEAANHYDITAAEIPSLVWRPVSPADARAASEYIVWCRDSWVSLIDDTCPRGDVGILRGNIELILTPTGGLAFVPSHGGGR